MFESMELKRRVQSHGDGILARVARVVIKELDIKMLDIILTLGWLSAVARVASFLYLLLEGMEREKFCLKLDDVLLPRLDPSANWPRLKKILTCV